MSIAGSLAYWVIGILTVVCIYVIYKKYKCTCDNPETTNIPVSLVTLLR